MIKNNKNGNVLFILGIVLWVIGMFSYVVIKNNVYENYYISLQDTYILFIVGVILVLFSILDNKKGKLDESVELIKNEISLFYMELDGLKNDYIPFSKIQYLKKKYEELYNNTKSKNKIFNDFNADYKNLKNVINNYNKEYIKRELISCEDYFDGLFGYKIDVKQRTAILTDDDNNLIVAGAGSGKTTTIIGKTRFLIDKKNVNPSEIITISFTNNAVNNFKQKLQNDLVECTTFHKLGLNILNQNENKKDIANENFLNNVIRKYLKEDIYNDKEKLKCFVEFCALYIHIPPDLNDKALGETYDLESGYDLETIKSKYTKYQTVKNNGNLTTLNSEEVKSYQELIIANYLFINGINYEYEKKYEHDTSNLYYRQYHPDFYLTDYGIYLEHFGINKEGRAPQYKPFEEQRYLDGIEAKREIHSINGTKLIETYSYNVSDGTIFSRIDNELRKYNVKYNPLDYKEMVKVIQSSENSELKSFYALITKFIKLFKGNNYSLDKMDDFLNDAIKFNNKRNIIILTLIKDIYTNYQEKLKQENQIDFDDMINLATEKVNNGYYNKKISYIIIDEFQDVSYSRYNLIKALQNKNTAKVIAVGDDWQSIYRFSGCDLDLFVNFGKYFNHPKVVYIDKTYRNSQNLIDISSSFIMKNARGQLSKKIVSPKELNEPIEIYYYKDNVIYATKQAIKQLKEIGCKKIAILGRNNSDLKKYVNKDTFDKEYDLSSLFDYPVFLQQFIKQKD